MPIADRRAFYPLPVRIMLVNWAPISDGAARGGGVNGYAQSLGLELVRRGHEVISLCGGMRYEADLSGEMREADGGRGEPGVPGSCRIDRLPDWQGIAAYEVVNSPVLAPSLDQFHEPLREVSAPELERAVAELVSGLRPDVVHFHNIEGFSAGCIPAIRSVVPTVRLFFSLHNYHTICPQVYLMQGHRRPCRSFDNGHTCSSCVPAREPAVIRRQRAGAEQARPSVTRAEPAPVGPAAARPSPGDWPPRFVPGRGPHPYYAADVPAWRPLLNVIEPEPAPTRPPNDYALRREAMVAALNACDRVIAVSDFVRHKFESMGVVRSRLTTVHIGSRMAELGAAYRAEHPRDGDPLADPAGRPLRAIRLAFMGYNNWYKGLPMLLDSLELLTPEVLARFHVHVYALQGQQMEPFFRQLEPRLGGLTLRHGYRYEEIPSLLSGIDLGVVPSVWWDNAPQTVMEFFACGIPVLAAELGGIPDFVRDGENGLLFRGNDRWDLARRLAHIAGGPAAIPSLAHRVRPPKTMAEHGAELERHYSGALS